MSSDIDKTIPYPDKTNDENAIREELHNNQYEDMLYYMDGRVYSGPLDDVA